MSLIGAFIAGTTGIDAQAQKLDAVSDNIANANTVGYKPTVVNFKTLVIPFEQVNRVAVANPYRGWWRLKLDLADFYKHVELDKATGLFRHLAITPDDPETFRATLEAALTRFRDGPGGGAEMEDGGTGDGADS